MLTYREWYRKYGIIRTQGMVDVVTQSAHDFTIPKEAIIHWFPTQQTSEPIPLDRYGITVASKVYYRFLNKYTNAEHGDYRYLSITTDSLINTYKHASGKVVYLKDNVKSVSLPETSTLVVDYSTISKNVKYVSTKYTYIEKYLNTAATLLAFLNSDGVDQTSL